MAKLIYSAIMSLDGYIADQDGSTGCLSFSAESGKSRPQHPTAVRFLRAVHTVEV